ncbi:MAG: VIT1/CCC1 transporter family protein [Planctomycetota bacterium]
MEAAKGTDRGRGSVLDPVERLSEILFGLIMALTFTGSIHALGGDREEIRPVLVGAIGCNIAWGIVDAVMYLMTSVVARSRALRALRELQRTETPEKSAAILADALPEEIATAMSPRDFESVRGWLAKLPQQPRGALPPGVLRGAISVFLLVTISTFPVVVPFLLMDDPVRALRFSHAVALSMLFLIGWMLGKHAGMRPWITGVTMLGIGVVLALVAIALGG